MQYLHLKLHLINIIMINIIIINMIKLINIIMIRVGFRMQHPLSESQVIIMIKIMIIDDDAWNDDDNN